MNRPTTNNGFRQESNQVPSSKNRSYKPLLQKNRGYKPLLQKITIPFPEEIHVDGGVSSLYPFLFLLLKQQKPGNLYASQRPFRCMLFNNFNIYCLKNV